MYFQTDNALEQVVTPFHRKVVRYGPGGGPQVYVDLQATPFNELAPEDLLDTSDVCRLFACSARTVYRWIAEFSLQPTPVGREYLFAKHEITRWYNAHRPRPGRPPSNRR
jgi:excisionase family DNA binding protein